MFNIQGRKWAKRTFLFVALAGLSAVSSFYTPIASAASNSLELSDISVLAKSEGVEGTIVKSGETDIEHSITFHKVGDSVDFSVKMTNKDAQKYVVESVAAENDNEYVVYEIGDYSGTIIQENGEFVFTVHEVYKTQLDDLTQRAQAAKVTFRIMFDKKAEEIHVNPKTSDELWTMIAVAVTCAAGLFIAISFIRKNKKALGVSVVLIAAMVLVPITAIASDNLGEINLIGEYYLNDRVTVKLNIDGEDNEVIVEYGEALPEPERPVKEGWTFIGWKDEEGGDYDFSKPVTEDIVLRGEWEANRYNVRFDGNQATSGEMVDQEHIYDRELGLAENQYKRQGYDFVGWNTKADGSGDNSYADKESVKNLTTEGTVILYAQWVARDDTPYTVYHKQMTVDGKSYETVETLHEHGTTDTDATPEVHTYEHFKSPAQQTKNIDGDGKMEIEYLYEREKYELKLIDADRIESEFTNGSYYYETPIIMTAKDVKGYTFKQWTDGTKARTIDFKIYEDTAIGPEYYANKYAVVFDKNGATDGVMDNYYTYYDVAYKLPENKFKRVGYDYAGWNTQADGNGTTYKDMEEVKNLAESGEVTLYAQWKTRKDTKYVVIHQKMDITGETYEIFKSLKLKGESDSYVTPPVTEMKGFITPKPQTVKIEPDGSTVVTYQYKRMKMTLTLTNEEFIESEFTSGEYYFETMISLTAKERKGYKFKKWSNGDTNTIISFKMTSNKTIGPEYLPNKYTVVFDKNGATSGSMDNYYTYYDEHFTLPDNQFKKEGYDFVGWNTQADGKGAHYNNVGKVFNLAESGEVTLYAQWKARKDTPYTVEHWQMNLNGKGYTLYETENLQGETDTDVTPAVKDYHGFKAPKTQTKNIDGDGKMKIVYEYERLKYTLTIADSSYVAEGYTSAKFYYGTVITLNAKSRKGYTFKQWTNGVTDMEAVFELEDDLTIAPVYEANKYTVVYDANGNNDITGETPSQIHTYDQKQKLATNGYKRAGYDFIGWARNKNAIALNQKIVGEDYVALNLTDQAGATITYYAQWEARRDTPYTVIHYLMNADGKTYAEYERKTFRGTTDTEVKVKVNKYEHYVSPRAQSVKIKGDGSAVVEYYYKREKQLLSLNDAEHIESEFTSGYYYYGTPITLTAKDVPGYSFVDWSDGSTAKTITFELLADKEIGPAFIANHYLVRFDGNGATSGGEGMDDIEMVYDGEEVELTANTFKRQGYDFAGGWKDGNGKFYADGAKVKNVTTEGTAILYAQWTPRDDTKYKVIHKVENLDGTWTTDVLNETGTTDTPAVPAVRSYEHHDTPAVQTKNISGDGSMEIVYEYPLSMIQLTLKNPQFITTTTPSGKYKYGSTITLTAKKRTDDYYFTNWTTGDETEQISFVLTEATEIGAVYAYDDSFHNVFYKGGPCKFNGPNAPMDGDGCEDNPDEEGYVDTHIALFSQTNLRKDFVVSFNISGLDTYSTNVNKNHEDYRPTFFNSTLEVGPGFPGVVVRRHDGTSNLMIGSNVVRNNRKISDMKIQQPMSSVTSITLIRKDDNFCYSINGGAPVFVNNYANHDATFNQTAFFGASIENGVIYRNLKGTMSNMTIKLGKDVHNRFTCEQP